MATKPKLSMPFMIRPVGNGETIIIIAKETYAPEQVRGYPPVGGSPVEPPKFRAKPGVSDSYNWGAALAHLETARERYLAEHKCEPPDSWAVKELRVYFKKLGGSTPADRTLRHHVQEWRQG